jgi:hypothetical protein
MGRLSLIIRLEPRKPSARCALVLNVLLYHQYHMVYMQRADSDVAIIRALDLFSHIYTCMGPRAYVTDVSVAGMLTRTPSMLLETIMVGPNTYMAVS